MDTHPALDALDAEVAKITATPRETSAEKRVAARAIGPLVKQLRAWRSWNQHKLAKRADVSMGEVDRLERGIQLPRHKALWRVAAVLREGEFVRERET